jgi:hypothetical protein
VELFHWSLYEIDRTDIESMIPFMFRYVSWKDGHARGNSRSQKKYADEVDWL